MFTGIVEATGTIMDLRPSGNGMHISICFPGGFSDMKLGDSIAVNGVCLTVKEFDGTHFAADVSGETLRVTTFDRMRKGDRVNLEKAMRLSDRLGGHIVTGHVDGTATLSERKNVDGSWRLKFSVARELSRYVIKKGAIAVDGISLTVNDVGDSDFSVNIIPHTAGYTTILDVKPGRDVNIEVDIIGKYVERLLGGDKKGRIDAAFLSEHGFA